MSAQNKYYQLWEKQEPFTDEEFSYLKKAIKAKNFLVKYGFYNKESAMKKQIAVVIDTTPYARRCAAENNWEIVEQRPLSDREIEEFINQYFKALYKRFVVFYYKNVDRLIFDDTKLEAVTPVRFIDECRKRNYSGSFQLKIEI